MEVSDQLDAPATLPQAKEPLIPIECNLSEVSLLVLILKYLFMITFYQLKSENLKGRVHLGDRCVHGRIILKDIKERGTDNVDWIHLNQDRIKLRTLVNREMNLQIL